MKHWRVILKLAIFLAPLCLLVLSERLETARAARKYLNQTPDDLTVYFIGSSRIRSGLDPTLLQGCLNHGRVRTLGVPRANFSHNVHLAEHLIRAQGHKLLFLEISRSPNRITQQIIEAHVQIGTDILELVRITARDADWQVRLEIWGAYLEYLSSHLYPKGWVPSVLQRNELGIFAFRAFNKAQYPYTDTFLRAADLDSSFQAEVGRYLEAAADLQSLARAHQAEVRFFLPLTFHSAPERAASVALFQALPDSLKVAYPAAFLDTMAQPAFLFDYNHLNREGAGRWSEFFCDYLVRSYPD